MAGVTLESVTKRFPNAKNPAVRDLSLSIPDGEFVVLVGPSGCGKSTTLRMIAGLESQSAGSIFIGDRRVDRLAPKHRDIAMIFQNYALYPHMTVRENLAFGLKSRHVKKSVIRKRVPEVAQILEMSQLLDRKPGQLSGGQRQRVAVGRALVREPLVFLMDEPLSNLDAKLRSAMRVELIKLHRRLETTIIYVTHDQVEALTMGSRIAVMHDGELQQFAPPDEIYDAPANLFVAGFVGSPSINTLDVTVRSAGDALALDAGVFQLEVPPDRQPALRPYTGKRLTLGVRPEDVCPYEQGAAIEPFTAQVDVVERMGNETIVHFKVEDNVVLALLDGRSKVRVGEELKLTIRPEHVHVFDPATGTAIR